MDTEASDTGERGDVSSNDTKPVLYSGLRVPFGELSADAFESFVYLVVERLGPGRGYTVVGKPASTGDGGFDVDAQRLSDQKRICIQCKRYTATPLGIPHVALELAKSR